MTTRDVRSDFLAFRRSGDAAALARVFDALAPKLLLLAAHVGRDGASAEDLVQTTFVQAMRDAARYDESRPLAAWLASILAHRAADEARRARLRQGIPAPELAHAPAHGCDALTALAERESLERIGAAIDGLEEPYREVLVLRTAHGLTPSEIAHALGRPPGTVRMQLQRARERLRERLPRELALPALFLQDEGRGLAAMRESLLAEAARTAVVVGGQAASASLASKLVLGTLVATAVGAYFLLRQDGRAPEVRSASLVGSGTPPAEVSLQLASAPGSTQAGAAVQARVQQEPTRPPEPRTPNVIGRVVAMDGTPVASARVLALEEGTASLQRALATTDAEGRFAAYDVPVDTWLGARAAGHQPASYSYKRGAVRVKAGVNEVELRLGAKGHRIAGTLVDASGAPLPDAFVLVAVDEDARLAPEGMKQPREAPDRESFVVQADGSGSFESDEVPADVALLVARAPEAGLVATQLLEVRAGRDERCTLVLGPGARLAGRVQIGRAHV